MAKTHQKRIKYAGIRGKSIYEAKLSSDPLMTTVFATYLLLAQRDLATPMKIGETVGSSYEKKASKDFTIALTKGTYRVIADTRSIEDGKPINVAQASVTLLKQNGAVAAGFEGPLMSWYEFDPEYREVKTITVTKNSGFRFRVKNSDLAHSDISLTVVSAHNTSFTPFAFGAVVTSAQVGADGSGGTLPFLGCAYQRVTLRPGKWSVSVAFNRDLHPDDYVAGNLRFLSEFGGSTTIEPLKVDVSISNRAEAILEIKKVTTYILKAKNISNNQSTLKYDITVRPSTESTK